MERFTTLRGFRDIYGEEIGRFRLIDETARTYFGLLGYKEIEIPVLEKTELFKRSIGDTTDIVEKEMFTFIDRSNDSVTLRPEATAGLVRAYLQGAFYAKERTSRLFSIGPMFRHERPQKGRFRQFYQVDAEVFGSRGADGRRGACLDDRPRRTRPWRRALRDGSEQRRMQSVQGGIQKGPRRLPRRQEGGPLRGLR